MFKFLAGFSKRFKWLIVFFWVVAAVVLFLLTPKLSKVGVTDQSQFLPQDTESSTAAAILQDKFASSSQTSPSSGLIVIYDNQGLSDTDMQQAQQLYDWLTSASAPPVITSVVSVFQNEALQSTLVSADNTTMIMSMDFSVSAMDTSAKEAITQIRDYIHQNFPNSEIYFTGDAGLLNDMFGSVQETIDRTTLVTLILVIILLLIIYRSPVALLLPLITIGCSYLVSLGLLGYLAQAGMQVSTLAEAYLVVIVFGIGTDYCLFIVSRFREELLKGGHEEARRLALRHIGPVIAASALTVIVAFLALGLSRFSMNQTMGYAMALGVAITLVAGLTLTPALISVFGKYVFWPSRNKQTPATGHSGWHAIGGWVSHHPVYMAVPILLLLALPYLAIPQMKLSAGIVDQMPQNASSVTGFNIFASHFPGGEFSPLYLMVALPDDETFDQSKLGTLDSLTSALAQVPGVARVDYYDAPVAQLEAFIAVLKAINGQVAQGAPPGTDALSEISSMGDLMQALPLQYPGIVQSQYFMQAAGALQTVQGILAELQGVQTQDIPQLLAQLQTALTTVSDSLSGLVQEFTLQTSSPFTAYLLSTYFSTDLTVAKVNVVLSGDPYASTATSTVGQLRNAVANSLKSGGLGNAEYYLGGEAATRADILNINNADFGRVTVLTIIGVLAVIALMLRSLLAPLYMVLTVLFNYGATLGIATWLFMDIMKKGSIVYMIPLFVFVVLVALGADYNIFLMSRIREEAHKVPMKKAVENAVGGTGGVITACGIILAGTFATLMSSALQVVFEIGAAIALGILIDTFLVRALLVPALASMLGRWSWWPSGLYFELRKHDKDKPKAADE